MSLASRKSLLLLLFAADRAAAWWDGKMGTKDPMTEAMEASRRAQLDPDALRKDPDHFKRMFGKLAIEQNQAKAMSENQRVDPADKCMACHAVVVEFEAMIAQRPAQKRDQLAYAEITEEVCHLNRYETLDPINPTKREERSRLYGGMAPPVLANACQRVVDEWSDYDEIEASLLKRGRGGERMHEELRREICDARRYGLCNREPRAVVPATYQGKAGLTWEAKSESAEQCSAPDGEKRKKRKKRRRRKKAEKMSYTIDG